MNKKAGIASALFWIIIGILIGLFLFSEFLCNC